MGEGAQSIFIRFCRKPARLGLVLLFALLPALPLGAGDKAPPNEHLLRQHGRVRDTVAAAAEKKGIGISRVIFDPKLQRLLFATEQGADLKVRLSFSSRRSWVRHDEHYHVDFSCPCKALGK